MGSVFSSSSNKDQDQPSPIAVDLRLALRLPDGPVASSEENKPTASSDKKNEEDDQQKLQENTSANQPNNRSLQVLQILSNPEFNPNVDLRLEHILELVDNQWEENNIGVTQVLSKIIDDLIGGHLYFSCEEEGEFKLAKKNDFDVANQKKAIMFLEKIIIQCALYQRCWLAMNLALRKYIQILNHQKQKNNNDKQVDDAHVALFNVIILGTPLRLVSKIITELKWVATSAAGSKNENNNQTLQKSQFRLLTQRLAREHATPKSEEQKMSASVKKKLQSEFVQKLVEPDQEVSKQVLIEFLRVSGAADYLNSEKDIKEAVELQTSDVVKEVLSVCMKPWSQIEATVGEEPMSWTCSGCNKRQYVTKTALALQKRGLTFPAGARVLSYLVCPCNDDQEGGKKE